MQQEADGLVQRQLVWECQRQLSQGVVQSPPTCLRRCTTPQQVKGVGASTEHHKFCNARSVHHCAILFLLICHSSHAPKSQKACRCAVWLPFLRSTTLQIRIPICKIEMQGRTVRVWVFKSDVCDIHVHCMQHHTWRPPCHVEADLHCAIDRKGLLSKQATMTESGGQVRAR